MTAVLVVLKIPPDDETAQFGLHDLGAEKLAELVPDVVDQFMDDFVEPIWILSREACWRLLVGSPTLKP